MNRSQITFGEISELRNGVNFVVTDRGVTTRVVGVGNFQARSEISEYDDLSEIQLKGDLSPEDELCDGDLLFVRSNGNKNLVGRCLVIRRPPRGITFSGFTIRARLDKSTALPDYIALVFQGGALNRQMALAGGGNGNISNLNQSLLASIPLTLPDINEQKHIVTCVSTWDTAIETTERLIAAKERHHGCLLASLLNSKAARQSWKTVEIGTIIHERSERSTQHDEHPVLTSSRRGLFLQSEYFSKQVTSKNNTGYKIMQRGDFTFRSMSDDGRFVFNRLDKYDHGIISPAYGVFYANGASPEFLAHYLNSSYFAQLLTRQTQGGTRKALRFSALADMEADLPKHTDQERIASILDTSRHEISLLHMQLDMLHRQKRGLMQKLLTGKWRIPIKQGVPT